jgi:hypothetical protein
MTRAKIRYAGTSLLLILGLLGVALLPGAALADEPGDPAGTGTTDYFCGSLLFEHPIAAAIAERNEVKYGWVMEWFCDQDVGLGQIALALYTVRIQEAAAEAAGEGDGAKAMSAFDLTGAADKLLGMRVEEGMGWGQIWQELGYIGRPRAEGVHPGLALGRPDHAGPPEDAGRPDGAGPPEDAGPPEWAGPPENPGPPEWAGPPANAGTGGGPAVGAGPPANPGPPENAGPPAGAGKPGGKP